MQSSELIDCRMPVNPVRNKMLVYGGIRVSEPGSVLLIRNFKNIIPNLSE